jgi:DNA invertase Pin-like site-specific DNA recombinase
MNVAIYARTASEEQSTLSQIHICREYALDKGWAVIGVYDDTGVNASKIEREGLGLFIQDAHRYNVLMVSSLDRLFREPSMIDEFIKGLSRLQIQLVIVDQLIP